MTQTSCPEARRTSNRRKKLRRTRETPAWKEAKKAFIAGKTCEWCGTSEYLLVHHPYSSSYAEGLYLQFDVAQCMVLCRRCHAALHHGLKLCPVCKENYAPNERETCWSCYVKAHPGITANLAAAKEQTRQTKNRREREKRERLHPCTYHRLNNGCKRGRIKGACNYSRARAGKCPHFKGKV